MFERETLRSVGRLQAVLVTAGVCLLAFTAVEMYVWRVVFSYVDMPLIAGLFFSIPANALLIGIGGYLPRLGISDTRYRGIAAWTLAGTIFLGLFSTITGVTFFPEIRWAQLSSVRWGVSVGAGVGLLVGVLNARSVERALAAKRSEIQAVEAERNEEFLEYMNALLRHEVLNTANVINGYADLLLTETTTETKQEVVTFTEVIQRQTSELTTVIDDARLLTQIETNDEAVGSVDVAAVLETELQNVRDRHNATGSEITLELTTCEDAYVQGDHLLRRVFSNLLMNAVEHNDGVRKRVDVVVDAVDDQVTVDIRDNGPGIPNDDCDDLFGLAVTEGVNHGLGLTIVARLVDRYGGDVRVVETGPEGTTISVSLLRSAGPATPDHSPSSIPAKRPVAE